MGQQPNIEPEAEERPRRVLEPAAARRPVGVRPGEITSPDEAVTGGAFGPEGGMFTTLLLLPVIVWLFRTPWLSESQRMVAGDPGVVRAVGSAHHDERGLRRNAGLGAVRGRGAGQGDG